MAGNMRYVKRYPSPLGEMLLEADEKGLTGIWFDGQKYLNTERFREAVEQDTEDLKETEHWLNQYFAGKVPDHTPRLHLEGTDFRVRVWEILLTIPYGQTMTYGQIAAKVAAQTGKKSMSAQAVGGAVGHNPISIIVPCHRVIGKDGSLTGYAGGLDKKKALLTREGIVWKEEEF